jgi:electron transport complex protein RnfG
MVNNLTYDLIVASQRAKVENALKIVLPDFDNPLLEDAFWVSLSEGDSLKVYPAKKNGEAVGFAVESNSQNGYSGEIKVIVGLDTQGKLINYRVLAHLETPGLGSKMEEWFRSDKNQHSVLGKDLSKGSLKVKQDKGDIDAITGATITSRAFLETLDRAYSAVSQNDWDASSGATNKEGGEK